MNILIPRNIEGRKEKLRQDRIKLLSQEVIEGYLDIDETFEGIDDKLIKVKEIKGGVHLTIRKGYIPSWLKDVKIYGSLYCQYNELTSLENCPQYVEKNFYCNYNFLTSLKGCPKYIGRSFRCSNNHLTSLSEGPEYVGHNFYCSYNLLNSLEGCPKYIGGYLYCDENIKKLKLPKDIKLKEKFYN